MSRGVEAVDWIAAGYRLVAELLLHPDQRDRSRVSALVAEAAAAPAAVTAALSGFLADPRAAAPDEYVQTVELSPPCPLYLGSYLFDEPTTCREVGTSGRNRYMLELVGAYGHFGLELAGRELPDHLPIVAEFLALSRERADRDRIGLRRWLLEGHVRPALAPLAARLAQYQSPYARIIAALDALVAADLAAGGDSPAWAPPAPRVDGRVRLPLAGEGHAGAGEHHGGPGARRARSQEERP